MTIDDENRQALYDRIGGLEMGLRNVRTERDELSAEVDRLRMLNERIAHDEVMVQQANEDLRAALAAVPVEAIKVLTEEGIVPVSNWTRKPLQAIKKWLKTQEVAA